MIRIDSDTLATWGQKCLKSTAISVVDGTQYVLQATCDTEVARHVIGIYRIGMSIAELINPPFTFRELKNGDVAVCKDSVGELVFGLLTHLECEEFSESFPLHELNPVCGRLLEMIEERQLVDKIRSPRWRLDSDGKRSLVAELNSFVDGYRQEILSDAFSARMNRYLAHSTEIERGLLSQIDHAFQRTSRAMAIRMDFGYKPPEALPDGPGSVDLDEATSHRDVLLMALRNVFEDSLLSCTWKLEHCREKGYGYHVLFILDACKVSDDLATGAVIGDAWDVAVTKGAGIHVSYNADSRISNAYGLGVISRRQTQAVRAFKEQTVTSMVRGDFFMQIRPELAAQTFGTVCHEHGAYLPLKENLS